ncbi:hypothetical protein [Lentzea sp. NPDC060358]|uniref:hypothetical protein n=1 Tax=Lentzea sp. NPDC060358 TaxID=3347103 RepID=UPI0036540276
MSDEARVLALDGKVAEFTSAGGVHGYLAVRVEKAIARRGRVRIPKTFVYMDAAIRSTADANWEFSDRADFEYDDSLAELTARRVDWYGMELDLTWLNPVEAEGVRQTVFGCE